MSDDLRGDYERYLERFAASAGADIAVGGFAKFKGRLIKKLGPDEFAKVHAQYHEMATHYFDSVDRGDTINDVIVKAIRDDAATLVLSSPV